MSSSSELALGRGRAGHARRCSANHGGLSNNALAVPGQRQSKRKQPGQTFLWCWIAADGPFRSHRFEQGDRFVTIRELVGATGSTALVVVPGGFGRLLY